MMENQPTNLFDLIKVNKIQKGFIEINSENKLIEMLISLFQVERQNQNKILQFISNSLLLGTYTDKLTLDQKYKGLVNEASTFEEIEVYNTLTDLCKLCWEYSTLKFETKNN